VRQSRRTDGQSHTKWYVEPPMGPASAQRGHPRRPLATSQPERRIPLILRERSLWRLELSGRLRIVSQSRRSRASAKSGQSWRVRRARAAGSS
jgi:hypothetical protein